MREEVYGGLFRQPFHEFAILLHLLPQTRLEVAVAANARDVIAERLPDDLGDRQPLGPSNRSSSAASSGERRRLIAFVGAFSFLLIGRPPPRCREQPAPRALRQRGPSPRRSARPSRAVAVRRRSPPLPVRRGRG